MNYLIKTSRLKLRELNTKDAEFFFVLNQDTEVLRYTGDSPFKDIEEAKVFLENYDQYEKFGLGRWAVVEKDTKELIGWCGLKQNKEGVIDIGFRFFRKYWNKGFATEAAKACLDYGLKSLKFKEIIARVSVNNEASIKVLEKIGMQYSHQEIEDEMGEIRVYKKLQLTP